MSSDRKTPNANPDFNLARGMATVTGAPPFDLQNVVLRVFPLRADIHALRLFCDRYLNIAPEFALFEPAAPLVFLQIINYGKMGAAASNFGWVSQNEVTFSVPLNWYRIENGQPTFHEPASVCPFIFVDEESSVRTGREVLGWPKSLARLTPGIDAWARDPRAPRTLFTLSAKVFPELFAGRRQEMRALFEIEQDPPPAQAEFPFDPFNDLNPMVSLPKAMLNSMRLVGDMLASLTRLPALGYPAMMGPASDSPQGVAGGDFRPASLIDQMSAAFGDMNPFAQLPAANTLNLKQFRDSAHPSEVCYQALVNSRMDTRALRRGGLLGQQQLALGDPSGGYRARFHRYKAWPIIESLGLEVASEESGEEGRVAVLEPVMPIWVETDFHYGEGEVICWRTRHTDWAPPPREQPADHKRTRCSKPDRRRWPRSDPARGAVSLPRHGCGKPHLYNTAEGGSLDQVHGPFHFPDVTMRVLPLLADERKLQTFCDSYLNHRETPTQLVLVRTKSSCDDEVVVDARLLEAERKKPPELEEPKSLLGHVDPELLDRCRKSAREPTEGLPRNMFRAWGRYVYLIVTSYEEMSSDLNVGWWARRQVSFAFPVKWYRYSHERGGWRLVSCALVSPYVYADSNVATTTGRELQGRPVVKAEIESPDSPWLEAEGPASPEELLRLSTGVYPAVNAGQKLEERLLLEVTGRDVLPPHDEEGWAQVAARWGETLVNELRDKCTLEGRGKGSGRYRSSWGQTGVIEIQRLALELLTSRRPMNLLSLKQFRDAEDPAKACYQAVTLSRETLERVHDLREIDDRLHVAVHRYPNQPIVDMLGLEKKWTDATGENVVDYLQPIRPFWLRASLRTDLGEDIFWRAGSQSWTASDRRWIAEPILSDDSEDSPSLYFEGTEPAPFNWKTLLWLKADHRNKRRLQELRSELVDEEAKAEEKPFWLIEVLSNVWSLADRLDTKYSEVTPQSGIEAILSEEWLNFDRGHTRWEQRQAAEKREFRTRMRGALAGRKLHVVQRVMAGRDFEYEERLYGRRFEEELRTPQRGAPPLKKSFIMRRDTIGHAILRDKFAKDNELEQLDEHYWYWLVGKEKMRRSKLDKAMVSEWWDILERSWARELESLERRAGQQLDHLQLAVIRGLPGVEESAFWISGYKRKIKKLRAEIKYHQTTAKRTGSFGSEYLQIQRLLAAATDQFEEDTRRLDKLWKRHTGARTSEVAAAAGWAKPTPATAAERMWREKEREKSGRPSNGTPAGESALHEGTVEPIELKPGLIAGLGKRRLQVLADHGVETVQDLLEPAARNFRHWLRGVSEQSAARILEKAEQVARGEAEKAGRKRP